MSDKPILFSTPMSQAILDDRKTQTRRILNPQPTGPVTQCQYTRSGWALSDGNRCSCQDVKGIRYAIGDRLWVRESYYQIGHWEPMPGQMTRSGKRQKWRFVADDPAVRFDEPDSFRKGMHKEDPGASVWHRRLGRFMPRLLSRITLEVTGVRVERLQDITLADELAEGAPIDPGYRDTSRDGSGSPMIKIGSAQWVSPRGWYHRLWDAINGPNAWDANPVVTVTEFRRVADAP